MKKRLLFISNGFAEDTVGAALITELRKQFPQVECYALPIVGRGEAYRQIATPLIGPHWDLPSQGIAYGKEFSVWQEIKAGAIFLYLGQIFALLRHRRKFDLVIGVGDYLSTIVSGLLIKKPLVYLWVTASHFDWVAKHFLAKYAVMIFSRWKTWTHLPEFSVEYAGNPYMDLLSTRGEVFFSSRQFPTLCVLPGSRQPAYNNLSLLLDILAQVRIQKEINVVFALSPKLEKEKFLMAAKASGKWNDAYILTHNFSDALSAADIVLGLSGTGNEQAAGLGKPVIAFWGGGPSREEAFVRWHYNYFIKEAGELYPPQPDLIAPAILSLLSNPAKMQKMGERGKELNGGSGAIKIIGQRITEWCRKN